jgi:hypothetical protein
MSNCIDHGYRGGLEGYALVWVGGKQIGRHRLAYCEHHRISVSSINGLVVRHLCDNTRCVNPNHLAIGSMADNVRDRIGKSQITRVLSDEEVDEMRGEYTGQYGQQKELAEKYSVRRTVAHRILNGSRR